MSIYEYNEEYVRKSFFEDGEKNGYDKGKNEGDSIRLVKSVEAAMRNFNVDLQTACEGVGTTVEEYRKAKKE